VSAANHKIQPDVGIKCAGFGGQGILALGEIIALAAMHAGRNVSWLPSYGPESRGGTCNCDVIISDSEIAAPIVDHPDVALVFNQPSVDRFGPNVRDQGTVLFDSGLARIEQQRDGIRYVGIPFTTIALELATEKVANMVGLGAYVAVLESVDLKRAVAAMQEKFAGKEAFFELNEKAIVAGAEAAAVS